MCVHSPQWGLDMEGLCRRSVTSLDQPHVEKRAKLGSLSFSEFHIHYNDIAFSQKGRCWPMGPSFDVLSESVYSRSIKDASLVWSWLEGISGSKMRGFALATLDIRKVVDDNGSPITPSAEHNLGMIARLSCWTDGLTVQYVRGPKPFNAQHRLIQKGASTSFGRARRPLHGFCCICNNVDYLASEHL